MEHEAEDRKKGRKYQNISRSVPNSPGTTGPHSSSRILSAGAENRLHFPQGHTDRERNPRNRSHEMSQQRNGWIQNNGHESTDGDKWNVDNENRNDYINEAVDEISRNMSEATMNKNNDYMNDVNGHDGVAATYINDDPHSVDDIWWDAHVNGGDGTDTRHSMASWRTASDGYIEMNESKEEKIVTATPGYGRINKVRKKAVVAVAVGEVRLAKHI